MHLNISPTNASSNVGSFTKANFLVDERKTVIINASDGTNPLQVVGVWLLLRVVALRYRRPAVVTTVRVNLGQDLLTDVFGTQTLTLFQPSMYTNLPAQTPNELDGVLRFELDAESPNQRLLLPVCFDLGDLTYASAEYIKEQKDGYVNYHRFYPVVPIPAMPVPPHLL